jgi:hypothetical protein
MTRKTVLSAAILLVAGLCVLLLLPKLAPVLPGGAARDGGGDGGLQIALRGVDLRDGREGGPTCRLLADDAIYSTRGKTVSAGGVTLFLPGRRGEAVVRAPRASWDLAAERIALPEGCAAEAPGGWSAAVSAGRIDLKGKVFEGEGKATIGGPGLAVTGERLVWNWKEGTLALEKPVSRIAAGAAARRKG